RPNYLDAAAMLGLACYLAGDGLAARAVWEDCRERRPEDPRVEAYLAMLARNDSATQVAAGAAASGTDAPPGRSGDGGGDADGAADGLERTARAALGANDRSDAARGLAGLRAVAPTRPLGRYARLAALDAADRGDTAGAMALLPGAAAAASDPRMTDSLLFVYGMAAVRARACSTAVPVFEGIIRRQREPAVADGAREGLG